MNEKINITLRVADQALAMTIDPKDEATLREAAQEVNKAWLDWRQRFEGRDHQEILAMVTLLFAKSYVTMRDENARLDAVLADFETNLDSVLALYEPGDGSIGS